MQAPVIEPPLSVQVNAASTAPLMVAYASDRENPFPLTVTVSPTTTVAGESVMLGIAIVNVAVAVSPEPPTTSPSAEIVWGPAAAAVTVNWQRPVIVPLVRAHVNVASTAPLTITYVSTCEKPPPVTVTVSPATPLTGDSMIPSVITVSVAVAVSPAPPTTFPTAVIV